MMASFFGEIRLLSSRAVDDEEADNQPSYKISIENTGKKAKYDSNINLLMFAVGEVASIFVKSHFLPGTHDLISTLKCSYEEKDDSTFYTGMRSNKNSKIIASVFTSNPGVLICALSSSVPEEVCFEATEILFKNFTPAQVLILTSLNMATFRRANSTLSELPFLKALSTSQYKANYSCRIPKLDPPNFLSNMPASILLKCEISKLAGLCVVNYVDINIVDSLNIEVFDDILKESFISQVTVNSDAKSKILRYVKEKQSSESNLYT